MKRAEVVIAAVAAAWLVALGRGSAVARSGRACAATGAASDDLPAHYGVRLVAPLLAPDRGRVAAALAQDALLHALYRPALPADYHVVVHPLFTARDAAQWWNQSWQTALASRWRALALVRRALARAPVALHPVVRGYHAGRYTLAAVLDVRGAPEEVDALAQLWATVRHTSGIDFGALSPADGSFVLRVPLAYRRVDSDYSADSNASRGCFCCPPQNVSDLFYPFSDEVNNNTSKNSDTNENKTNIIRNNKNNNNQNNENNNKDTTSECCLPVALDESEEGQALLRRVEARLGAVLGAAGMPVGARVRVGAVQMAHFRRQGEARVPKHWAIHYLLPGGRDERLPVGALLCLVCPIAAAVALCVARLRRVPLVLWDVKRR